MSFRIVIMAKVSVFSSFNVWRVVGVWMALAAGSLGLRAQEVWTSGNSPTTQDLWGVCYGAGQFVAVGKAGTILTSLDGRAWTVRASGTTEWLTAVAYGAGKYIAVGDAGMILTSVDGVVWSRVPSPRAQRLNGILFELGSFLVVGEQHTLLWSEEGSSWYALENRGPSNWLRGVAYAQGGIVMVGDRGYFARSPSRTVAAQVVSAELGGALEGVAGGAGTVVMVGAGGAIWRWPDPQTGKPQPVASGVTTDLGAVIYANTRFVAAAGGGTILVSKSGSEWALRATPAMHPLRALAASDSAFVAVGLGGSIVRSDFAQSAPEIVVPPKSVIDQAGNSSVLFEVHAAGSAPLSYQWLRDGIAIAGATESRLVLATAPEAGSYAVRVTNGLGSVVSPAAQLTLTPATLPSGLVDATYTPQVSGAVHAIAPLADGRVLIGGHFSYLRDTGTQACIARLTPGGQFDPTFDVGFGIEGGLVTTLALQSDGKVLVGGSFTQVRGEARTRLVRLNADGSVDPSFTPPAELAVPTQLSVLSEGRIVVADGGVVLRWLRPDGAVTQSASTTAGIRIARFAVRPSGSVVVAGSIQDSLRSYGRIAEFSASGTPVPLADQSSSEGPQVLAVRVLADGDVLLARFGAAGARFAMPSPTVVTRLGASYLSAPQIANAQYSAGAVWLYEDGRVVLSSQVSGTDSPLATGPVAHSLLRFNADGSIDDTFLRGPGVDGNIYAMAGTADGSLYVGGAFTSVAGTTQPRLARLRATGLNPVLPRAFVAGPRYLEVPTGEVIRLRGQVAGTGPLRLRWQQQAQVGASFNSMYVGSSTTELNEVARDERWSGYYSLLVEGPAGVSVSDYVYVKVVASKAPVVTRPMISQRAYAGRGFVLGVSLEDYTGVTYQWYRNGVALTSQPGASLMRDRATLEDAGFYEVVVTNALGSQRLSAMLEVVVAPTLINVATRAPVASESQTLIVGFVLAGSGGGGSRSTIIRGVGPGLERFAVQGTVSDPRLAVFDSTGRQTAANDNWQDQAGATSFIGAKGFPLATRDAGVMFYAADGAYTVQVNGVGAAQGVALAEIYEDDSSRIGRIVNLSSRAFVGTGENILIPGFVLEGEGRAKFLIRGIGPTLSGFGVQGALANPTLRVLDREGRVLATNDDWGAAANASDVMQAAARSGAFALPPDSRDAAVLIELPAGSYTAQLSGVGDATGVGLVEVYEVP